MNGRHFFVGGALLMLIALCLVAGIGMSVYNMGVVRGMYGGSGYVAPAPAVPAPAVPPSTTAPYPDYGPVGRHFGWGIFGFIGPIIGIVIFFMILRLIFRPFGWHHYRRWGGGGPWGGGVPPFFDEWHRQAHGQAPQQPGQGQPPSQQWQQPGQGQQPNQQWQQPGQGQPQNPQWQQPSGPWQTPPPPTAGPAPER